MNPTDAMDAGDVTAIFCPECGDEVEDLAPENFLVPGVRPGYRPAEPVEHQPGV